MRTLFVDLKTLTINSNLTVRDSYHNVVYLVTGKWGSTQGQFNIYSIYGKELARICQTTVGLRSCFKISVKGKVITQFKHILNLNHEFFYLPHLKWFVLGSLRQMHYRIITSHQVIMNTQTLKYPSRLQINISKEENEPLCLCLIAILNYWALTKLYQPFTAFSHQSLMNLD